MRISGFRNRVLGREVMSGTFVKVAEVTVMEVLARTSLDFLILDAEHCGYDRGRLDACLAVLRAMDVPALVRIPSASAENVLMALDAGAVGLVVPHVDSVEKARALAKSAHFGDGGRGFAGSTRWAGFATRPMGEVLAQDAETVVIAQIEEPAGVEAAKDIAAVEGIDALFAGPADLSVAYGHSSPDNPDLPEALSRVGAACEAAGKGYFSWVGSVEQAADWRRHGINGFVVQSEHSWIRQGAEAVAAGVAKLA